MVTGRRKFLLAKEFLKKKKLSVVWALALKNYRQPCLRPIIVKYIGLKGNSLGARMAGTVPACEHR
jgi:hypothetical protein